MIKLPTRFASLLHCATDDVSATVGNVLTSVVPFLIRNEALFFPDYTDHGIEHVESVLRTSELLISDDAWNMFTREDAAVLVLASLAHDLGMLVDADGFRYLVENDPPSASLLGEKDASWQELWREFRLEVRRFDGATLNNIVGSTDPISLHELELSNLNDRGIRVIGEFLRRYHHRLGCEIVFFGFPSGNGRIPLFSGASTHIREIAGLVAGSHGLPLRNSLEIFAKYGSTSHREYRHIHPTYLMALVRLADYLDLDISRAPDSILSAKVLRSPVSRREWWSHRAVVDCHSYDNDPECLKVVVDPSSLTDVFTFVTTEDKISKIQQELDSCWAVLGETYGRFPPLNRLSIRIRRIRSDLREPSKISRLSFVPQRASLGTARADLIKLLIEPLYGDHPGIGIRELIQNSIDAVRELDFISHNIHSNISDEREELECDVVVQLEQDERGDYWVTVADRGIGMTWETVKNYYLTAGASFRQSDAWKKSFADDSGASRVLRAGRFGIGVLAGFLIGDHIKVSTRNFKVPENEGVEFEFGLDDNNIELRWLTRKIGTTVKIKTTKSVIERLAVDDNTENWDWYCLKQPKVIRRILLKRLPLEFYPQHGLLKQQHEFPGAQGPLPADWHRIEVPGFNAIDWTYAAHKYYRGRILVCNGLLIPNGGLSISQQFSPEQRYEWGYGTHLHFAIPTLSVFDPDGRFPLNLARSAMRGRISDLESLLVDDLCRNFIAFCLLKGPEEHNLSKTQTQLYLQPNYRGLTHLGSPSSSVMFFSTREGFGLTDAWNISRVALKRGLLIRSGSYDFQMSKESLELAISNYGFIIITQSSGALTDFDEWHRLLLDRHLGILKNLNMEGIRILMPLKWYERFIDKQPKYVVKSVDVQLKTDNYVILNWENCRNTESTLATLSKELLKKGAPIENMTELFLSNDSNIKPGRIAQVWKETIGSPIIPFDKEKRQGIINALDKQFKRHLAQWKHSAK